ncbi:MAG: hypothetical protein ACRYFX_02370 [Janthinobacterium lividum]
MHQTTIHQPAPCDESWEAMTPTDVGRHCAACQTQVVDFTQMTDGEVVAFVSQYNPVRRCGRFREDQVGRPLLAAARPVTGWRRWAVATVLLAGSVFGLKARAQGVKPGHNDRVMSPAATSTTHSGIPDSMFLVQGVVRNRWGIRKAGVQVRIRNIRDSTNAKGYFHILLPKSKLETTRFIQVSYWHPPKYERHSVAYVAFDPTRTTPYHIKLKKYVNHNPGFF